MQPQMPPIIPYHPLQRNTLPHSIQPHISQLTLIHTLHHMRKMQIRSLPQGHQILPGHVLIILKDNPPLIVPIIRIIRKHQRRHLVLQMHHPMCIVRSRITHMTHNHLNTSLLRIKTNKDNIRRQRQQLRLPNVYESANFSSLSGK